MNLDKLELIEQTVIEMVHRALLDFAKNTKEIFGNETDLPQDIAEDVTREAMDNMGLSNFSERLYGKVDYKKSIYVFIPDAYHVALMLDSKAEKQNGDNTATLQMSQISMEVKMFRSGREVRVKGKLDEILKLQGEKVYVVTIIVKYIFKEINTGGIELKRIRIACVPNGMLQNMYNPNAEDTIWLAGRNAPTLGEEFRVRLNYKKLKEKAAWRVRDIEF